MNILIRSRVLAATNSNNVPVLKSSNGSAVPVIQGEKITVGSRSSARIQLNTVDSKVECEFEFRSGRLFCRCPAGDEDFASLLALDTQVYLEGSQLRASVDYLVAPGAKVCFGDGCKEYLVAEFEEPNGSQDALSEMLMKGMVSNASKDIQNAMKQKFD